MSTLKDSSLFSYPTVLLKIPAPGVDPVSLRKNAPDGPDVDGGGVVDPGAKHLQVKSSEGLVSCWVVEWLVGCLVGLVGLLGSSSVQELFSMSRLSLQEGGWRLKSQL